MAAKKDKWDGYFGLIFGRNNIARYLHMTLDVFKKYIDELLASGIIFYMEKGEKRRGPNDYVMVGYPGPLAAWRALLSYRKGHYLQHRIKNIKIAKNVLRKALELEGFEIKAIPDGIGQPVFLDTVHHANFKQKNEDKDEGKADQNRSQEDAAC